MYIKDRCDSMETADIAIIGAGIIGLAIANEIGSKNQEVIVLEKHETFGQESSSRNSEVIHSGIYYPKGFLKTKLCIEGRKLLYEFCNKYNIPHKQIGKLIVATNKAEIGALEKLINQGKENGVEGLKLLTEGETKKLEPNINAVCAIHSPQTGIIDSHHLMKKLESLAKEKGVTFAYGCEVINIEKEKEGYKIDIIDTDGERLSLFSKILINSAGLYSDRIAEMTGINIEEEAYKLHYSKGEYFRMKGGKAKLIHHLIYPTPKETNLGIHTDVDLQDQVKLGPNAFYVNEIDYDVEPQHVTEFYESTKRFLPFLELEDLSPDTAGIRPKLQKPGEPARDFVIANEKDKGFPNLVNLIGIESPGLTASLAIANYVAGVI